MQLDGEARVRVACPLGDLPPWLPSFAENAVLISRRLVDDDRLTSAPVYRRRLRMNETKLGAEELTKDLPNVDNQALRHLDDRGIVRAGAVVRRGDVLAGLACPVSRSELSAVEKLWHTLFGRHAEEVADGSLRYPHRDPGLVCDVRYRVRSWGFCVRCGHWDVAKAGVTRCPVCGVELPELHRESLPRECRAYAEVTYLIRRLLCVGDVLEDERGQRYSVAGILAEGDMPATPDGPVDVLVFPSSTTSDTLTSRGMLKHGRLKGNTKARRAAWGEQRWKKLTTLFEQKVQAQGVGRYDETTQAPCTGVPITEPLAVALARAGYVLNLTELLTLKSDDVSGRESLGGTAIRPGIPEAAERLLFTLRAAGFVPEYRGPEWTAVSVRLATPQDVREWSFGEVKKLETINTRTYRPEMNGLFCERIFGPEKDWECACGKYRGMKYKGMICDRCGVKVTHSRVRRRRCGHVELAVPVVHPWFLADAAGLVRAIGVDEALFRRIVDYRAFVVAEPGRSEHAVGDVIDDYAHDMARYDDEQYRAESGGAGVRLLLKQRGCDDLAGVVLECLCVPPPGFRPMEFRGRSGKIAFAPVNQLYRWVVERNEKLKRLMLLRPPELILREEFRRLQEAVNALFRGTSAEQVVPWYWPRRRRSLDGELADCLERLLHKKTNLSARGVVIPDADVPMGRIGVPLTVAAELYSPLAGPTLVREGFARTARAARALLRGDTLSTAAWGALVGAMQDRPALVLSDTEKILALQPYLVAGEAFRVCPENGVDLSLRYAGDRVTLHVPVTQAAIRELREPTPVCTDGPCLLKSLTVKDLVRAALGGEGIPLGFIDRIALGLVPLPAEEPPAAPDGRSLTLLNLSRRTRRCLTRHGITTIGEIIARRPRELYDGWSFGLRCLEELQTALAGLGLRLRPDRRWAHHPARKLS